MDSELRKHLMIKNDCLNLMAFMVEYTGFYIMLYQKIVKNYKNKKELLKLTRLYNNYNSQDTRYKINPNFYDTCAELIDEKIISEYLGKFKKVRGSFNDYLSDILTDYISDKRKIQLNERMNKKLQELISDYKFNLEFKQYALSATNQKYVTIPKFKSLSSKRKYMSNSMVNKRYSTHGSTVVKHRSS